MKRWCMGHGISLGPHKVIKDLIVNLTDRQFHALVHTQLFKNMELCHFS